MPVTGHQCFHNTNYWQFGDYLGIGAGAHSKLSFAHRVVQRVRFRDPTRYMDNALAGHAVAQDDDVRRADHRLNTCSTRCACAAALR